MVMPGRPGKFGRIIDGWNGERMVIVTQAGFPIEDTMYEDENSALRRGGWKKTLERRLLDFPKVHMFGTFWERPTAVGASPATIASGSA